MTSDTRARARIYKDRNCGRWAVDLYWRGSLVHREQRYKWDDARASALRWVGP